MTEFEHDRGPNSGINPAAGGTARRVSRRAFARRGLCVRWADMRLLSGIRSALLDFVRKNPVLGLSRGCIAVGALFIVAAWGSWAARAFVEVNSGRSLLEPMQSPIIQFQLRHHLAIVLAQTTVGILLVVLGTLTKPGQPWTRAILEALTWLFLAGNVIYIPLFVYSVRNDSAFLFMLIGSSVVTVFWVMVLARFIGFIRSPVVRQAFEGL